MFDSDVLITCLASNYPTRAGADLGPGLQPGARPMSSGELLYKNGIKRPFSPFAHPEEARRRKASRLSQQLARGRARFWIRHCAHPYMRFMSTQRRTTQGLLRRYDALHAGARTWKATCRREPSADREGYLARWGRRRRTEAVQPPAGRISDPPRAAGAVARGATLQAASRARS